MSDLAATNCGGGCDCNNGCNSIIWIILLLSCCGGNGSFLSNGDCGCGGNNSCMWLILLLLCGCGGSNSFGLGCGCGCGC